MSVTGGFYNSIDGDRKYNATHMSSIFDGIINDGVFMSIGGALNVTATTDMTVQVDTGRAWFNHTWTNNDAILPLVLDASEVILNRIDAVVIEINNDLSVRANSIKIVKGSPANSPVAPVMLDTELVHQYALAYIYIAAGVVSIVQANITNNIGVGNCPYVTGVLETINIDNLIAQWGSQWDEWFADETTSNSEEFTVWFNTIKGQLSGDVAASLANAIYELDTSKADKTEIPTSLPANGGNSDTVDNFHVAKKTQAEYDAIVTKDANTLYIIVG